MSNQNVKSVSKSRDAGLEQSKKRYFRDKSFGVYLFTSIVALLIITVVAIVGYVWYQDSKTLKEVSRYQMDQVTDMVKEKVTNYLMPAATMARLSSEIFRDGGFDPRNSRGLKEKISGGKSAVKIKKLVVVKESADIGAKTGDRTPEQPDKSAQKGILSIIDRDMLDAYGIHVLNSFPQVPMINIGDEQGNFMMPKKMPEGTINTKIIDRSKTPVSGYWKNRDKNGNITEIKPIEAGKDLEYDPRTRAWYIGAKGSGKSFWTDPYILFSDQAPGITTAYPIINSEGEVLGVLSLDIALNQLSTFLRQLKIGKTGIAYIIGSKKEIIAYPDPSRLVKPIVKENGEKGLGSVNIDEMGIAWVEESFRAYVKNKSDRFEFESGGKRYLGSFTNIGAALGKDWKIAVVVPENDFLERLIHMRRVVILISSVILLISVFIANLIARGISRPIAALTKEAKKIEKFELDEGSLPASTIKEIQQLNNSMFSMKLGLKTFEKYVPSELVRELIRTGQGAKLGGGSVELTIFFSDIQGFTNITETVDTEVLMNQLFEYNNELTNIIKAHKGTIDKYIGDSIMAFWGAPTPIADHAYLACSAALLCHRKLKELNEKWEREGKSILITRMGMNTGKTIVGNMGSNERMNYSVLGDSVNLASRVEGVNKNYGTHVIITHSTYRQVSDRFVCRLLDIVAVKGKTEGVRIYELIGRADEELPEETLKLCEIFKQGFDAYLKQKWDEALKIFSQIEKEFPEDKVAAKLYIERCTEYKKNPPGKDWDGVAHLKTK